MGNILKKKKKQSNSFIYIIGLVYIKKNPYYYTIYEDLDLWN